MERLQPRLLGNKYLETLLKAARHAHANGIVPPGKENYLQEVIQLLEKATKK